MALSFCKSGLFQQTASHKHVVENTPEQYSLLTATLSHGIQNHNVHLDRTVFDYVLDNLLNFVLFLNRLSVHSKLARSLLQHFYNDRPVYLIPWEIFKPCFSILLCIVVRKNKWPNTPKHMLLNSNISTMHPLSLIHI